MQPKTKSGNINNKKVDEKMVDKVNKQMENDEESLMARVIGLGLVLFGFIFVVLTVVLLVLSTRPPRIDENLTIPEISAEEYTNSETVKVQGSAPAETTVMFFVDGEEVEQTTETNDEGLFVSDVPLSDEEKSYEITAATLEGFPLRKRSKQSEPIAVTVDKSAPSADADIAFDPISRDGKFVIQGNTGEGNTTITITDGENEYTTVTDENGAFVIEGIELKGKNTNFTMTLTDRAGNTVALEREIAVEFPNYDTLAGGGDLNGDGVADGPSNPDLPEASGPLDDAMDVLFGNELMVIFGMVALSMLLINGGLVAIKASRD